MAGVFPITAAAARAGSPGPAASFTISGGLAGVAATSANAAWAVGYSGSLLNPKALIVHWNGTAWTPVPNPAPAGSTLSSVAAISATSAWAVGSTGAGKSLIERWNGAAWKQVPSPSPGVGAGLSSVAATSATNAWAVGFYSTSTGANPLILRWNGRAWKQMPSPSLINGTFTTLILRWNGTAWKRALSPSPGTRPGLSGVAATSATNAWAVGDSVSSTNTSKTLILHWTGTAWKVS